MQIRELCIQHFRGFSELVVKPAGHVVLIGEPRSGRSDLIDAIGRVLDADMSRSQTTNELDFYVRDTNECIRIQVVLGGLDETLQQDFWDQMELWDTTMACLISEADDPADIDHENYEWVLRLGYRARWLPDDERCDETIFYAKESDPESNHFARVARRDLRLLGFRCLDWGVTRVLDLGPRGNFRRLVDGSVGEDFADAIAEYLDAVSQAASRFTETSQVKAAVSAVLNSLHGLSNFSGADETQLFQFTPDGGSLSGLLRSLRPAIDFADGAGNLPVWRQGSTTTSELRVAEALALGRSNGSIIAVDDLGDGMDAGTAAHFASVMKKHAGQAWITTRTAAVGEVFSPQEIVRLGRGADGRRVAHQGKQPTTKAENVAAKHWHRNLLPAMSFRSVIIVEGPNDFTALHNLALRLFEERDIPLPASRGVAIISAGATGAGGYANVLKLANNAKDMGLRVAAGVDGDVQTEAQQHIASNVSSAHAIVRLPQPYAIERAMVEGVTDVALQQAVADVALSAGLGAQPHMERTTLINFIKRHSLHGPFIDALPPNELPPIAVKYLDCLVEAAVGTYEGLIQI